MVILNYLWSHACNKSQLCRFIITTLLFVRYCLNINIFDLALELNGFNPNFHNFHNKVLYITSTNALVESSGTKISMALLKSKNISVVCSLTVGLWFITVGIVGLCSEFI